MKIFRHIAFLLSLLVILGHDIIPHVHEDEEALPEHTASLPFSPNSGLGYLGHLLAHFQHGVAETHLVYMGTVERKTGFRTDGFHYLTFISLFEYPQAWYANYKKHRFRGYEVALPDYNLKYFSLRGPPSFC